MYARIGSFLVTLARFLIPFAGKSKNEKISNWIVGILILILGIGQALPYLQEGGDIVLPAPIEEIKPDILDTDPAPLIGKNGALLRYIAMISVAEAASCRPLVVDAAENEADTEATEPDPDPDLAPADYLGIILGMFAPVGCAPAQQAVIVDQLKDYGTRLGLCLAKAGLAWLGDLVYSRGQGEILDLSEVPNEFRGIAKDCAMQLGGYVLTDILTGPLPDSVGATMPYASKVLMLLDNQDEVCGDVCLVYVP